MVKLTINGKEIEVEQGTALIQACEKVVLRSPVFCYHERLMVAGNCRMCLVESKGAPKPLASCAFQLCPVSRFSLTLLSLPRLVKVSWSFFLPTTLGLPHLRLGRRV